MTKFSKPNPNLILAGGAGKNEFKIFENNADGSATFRVLCSITDLESPVLSLDHSKTGDNFAFGCQNGKIYMCNHKLEEGDFEGYQGGQMKIVNVKKNLNYAEEDEEEKNNF